MQLTYNNQTMNLSLTKMKNNLGNSKIWEVSKQHQFHSANRINLNEQNQTSKEIIEKFTEGLDRQTKVKEPLQRSVLNSHKNTHLNVITKDVSSTINSESKNNLNLNNNINRSTHSKLNTIHKNIPQENKIILNLNRQNINKNKLVKLDSAIIVQQEDSQKNKLKNKKSKYLISKLKRNIEIQEAGHNKIVHSINDNSKNHDPEIETKNPEIPLELTKIKLDLINRETNKGTKSSDSIENNSIDINYHEDNSFSSTNSEDFQRDFKNTLIQLTEYFNTKIKGEITGNYSGEFEIKTDLGFLSINMKRIKNQLEIIINSQSIDELQDQITNIEDSILDKIPELDTVTIMMNYVITDNNLTDNKLNNEKQIHKAQINQNSFFNLNYLA